MITNVAIAGAGRMGQALAESVAAASDLKLAGVWERGASLLELLTGADVLVDFSLPSGTEEILSTLQDYPLPLVCGVSGLNDAQRAQMQAAAVSLPIVYDRNMSLGIAVLQRCVADAAKTLGAEFSVQICETHHEHKKDAPSGTALKLADAVTTSRQGLPANEVEFDVQRRGEVPGDHKVIMRSAAEEIAFSHSVTTRQVFVDGALRAARWLTGSQPGLYSMQNVLFADQP